LEGRCIALHGEVAELSRSSAGVLHTLEAAQARIAAQSQAMVLLEQQRDEAEQMLAECRALAAGQKEALQTSEREKGDALAKATELRRLWETEVASRNAVGKSLLALQEQNASHDQQLQKERARTAKALAHANEKERRCDSLTKRIVSMQGRIGSLEAQVTALADKARAYESGATRPAVLEAELETRRHAFHGEMERLRQHAENLSVQLTTAQREKAAEALRGQEALQERSNELEHLRREKAALLQELQSMRAVVDMEFVHESKVSRLLRETQQENQAQLHAHIAKINTALHADSAAREAVGSHERLTFEQAVQGLQEELRRAKADLQSENPAHRVLLSRP
jgi:hypothetical protein